MSEEENNNLKWSGTRIVSAAVLSLLVLAAIAYGIFTLVNNGSIVSNKPVTQKHQIASVPSPAPGQKNNNNAASNNSAKSNQTNNSIVGNSNSSSSLSSTKQLTNTGPGQTALYAFIGAVIVGYSIRYGLIKYRITKN